MEPKLVEKDLQRSLISSKIAQLDVQFTKYSIPLQVFSCKHYHISQKSLFTPLQTYSGLLYNTSGKHTNMFLSYER